MWGENKKNIYLGIVFLIIQIIVIVRNCFDSFINFYWFCDFSPIIFAVAFFFGRKHLAKGLVNILLFFQFAYLIFMFNPEFFRNFGSIFADFIIIDPAGKNWLYLLSSYILHISSFLALFFTLKVKPSLRTLLNSFGILIVVFIILILFTNQVDNINYLNLLTQWNGYDWAVYFWVPVIFVFVVLPIHGIQYLLWRVFYKKIN